MTDKKKYAIIVAGGKGERMGADIPKQFLCIANKPILHYSIDAFYAYDPSIEIIVVLPEQHISVWEEICKDHNLTISYTIVAGGTERFYSVKNGLACVTKPGLVAIHDGVRPLVSHNVIADGFACAQTYGGAIPVVESIDSLRLCKDETHSPINRNQIKRVQTPQVFQTEALLKAYNQEFNLQFTDDASVFEHAGFSIRLFTGDEKNIKITNSIDLLIADIYIQQIL